MVVPAWPAGDLAPICVSWAARSAFVAAVMRAMRWSNAGHAVGALDAQTPALADAIMAMRGEWSAIETEAIDRQKREAARNGIR